jgi:hypothetical protein
VIVPGEVEHTVSVSAFDRSEIDALIDLAAEQVAAIRSLYKEALAEKTASHRLRAQIKNALENQRSALEYVAHAIVEHRGDPGSRCYYPIARQPSGFLGVFSRNMRGVTDTKLRDAIEARQPYQPEYDWLGHLATLTNENKHQRLTPQTRTETRQVRVDLGGGGRVEYQPFEEGKGGVSFGPGVFIGGVPVDPATQRPVPAPTQTVTEMVYVDWLFEEPRVSALGMLERIQAALPSLIDEVLAAARL